MARSRIAIALAAASFTLLACNELLGISDYEKVDCDDGGVYCIEASIDAASESGAVDSDGGLPQDGAPFDGPVAATDGGWARWPMPNPDGGAEAGWPNVVSYEIGVGYITDAITQLQWRVDVSDPTSDPRIAAGSCPSGWRLPTRIQLASLIDFTRVPALDPVLAYDGGTTLFWTASPIYGTDGGLWAVDFADGRVTAHASGPRRARCVRRAP